MNRRELRRGEDMSATESKAPLSAYEISNAKNEHERLSNQLANFCDRLARNETDLRDVAEKQSKAERLLGLTENSVGFTAERERALYLPPPHRRSAERLEGYSRYK